MNKRKLTVSIVLLTVLVIALAIGTSAAWYITGASSELVYEIPSNGYLVIQFDTITQTSENYLKPAVATKNAIKDTIDFDVYDPLVISEYVQEVATVLEFEAVINLYDSSNNSWENPLDIQISFTATAISMDESYTFRLSLERDLRVYADIQVIYADEEVETYNKKADGFVFSVSNQAILKIKLSTYLYQLGELCDPAIKHNNITIAMGVTVINQD